MTLGEHITNRSLIEVRGEDRKSFLQGLITNDIGKAETGLIYAAMLSPQGKYLADFFVFQWNSAFIIDVIDTLSDALFKRLSMYKLRAKVDLAYVDIPIERGLGDAPDTAYSDPRDERLGWRGYGNKGGPAEIDWNKIRVEACIPESCVELITNESYILEAGFERLNGVDFRKGCYVGQEVTARMKHKTELRKGFVTVRIEGAEPVGTPIEADGKVIGKLYTQSHERAIAYLRFDKITKNMYANATKIHFLT